MPKLTVDGLPRRPRRWRAAALAGLSLADDVAIGALAHARWLGVRAVPLGPKGMLAGSLLGLAAGAVWCAVAGRRAPLRRADCPATAAADTAGRPAGR